MDSAKKILSCFFLDDVLCSYRKGENFGLMNRCLKCPHRARFISEMDEEDQRVEAEIEEIRKYGYDYVGKKRRGL